MPEISKFEMPSVPGPKRLGIYSLVRPLVNERSLLAVGRKFGLKATAASGEMRSDANKLSYSEGAFVLTMYRQSGALRFIDRTRWQVDDRKSDATLSDENATALARRFLSRTRLVPVRECRFLKVSRLHVATMSLESRESEERTIGHSVIFRRLIKGVPADGPGGHVIVYLDHAGEVTGYDQIWRPLRPSPRAVRALRTPAELRAELEEFSLHFGRETTVEVLEARFGYFESGQREVQRHLQPAYVFLLRVTSPDPRIHRKSVYVASAATNGPGTLTPRLKPSRPQPPRPITRVPVGAGVGGALE